MGLIKAVLTGASNTLKDSWKEFIYCDSIDNETIVVKGQRRTGKGSSNKGNDNVITDGSGVVVNEGQCMIIVEQGKVIEICAEPGEYTYQTGTSPSLFSGKLGEGVINTFKQIGKNIAYGGDVSVDQRVYYFNTKELIGNKYGTPSPVPFRVVDNKIGLDVDISIKCFGEYSYRVTDPILFYTNVCGNVRDSYERSEIDGQLKTELLTALQPAFAKISDMGIRYSSLPGHTLEISDALNEVLSKKWRETRGIEIASFGVSSVKASEEDEKMIKELQKNAVNMNANMAAATLVSAQAQAMQDAAKNSGGAMMGFAGLNMTQGAGGINANALFQQGAAQAQPAAPAAAGGWTCPSCGATNTGKFCTECGTKKPEVEAGINWFCPECGQQNTGKFCTNCGTKKP